MTTKEINYYERIASSLIGQKIVEIYYEEINQDPILEFWEYSSEIHSIDMNVIFKLDNGKIIQIKWNNEFYCYGVGFEVLEKIELKNDIFKTINVTNHVNWKNILNKKITEVSVFWETINRLVDGSLSDEILNNPLLNKLPQTWEIKVENEKIWISTLEIRREETVLYWADHLTILFSEKSQQKFKLIELANKKYIVK
ncbi:MULTISPECIES: hypothetical protein [Flavobacterium]|uniref:Uncharacterized protein n=1 Tax=Flavobacterium jumunjinense TaxID=998845 RepID=A0ABV5GRU6_9FLAO|nr:MULTISPECIES: hypothetical protein [Flavobacterium]